MKFFDDEIHFRNECMSEILQTTTLKAHRGLSYSTLDLIQRKTRETCFLVARLHVETR